MGRRRQGVSAHATVAIRKGRRRVKVARVRLATPEEVEAQRQVAIDRRPANFQRRFIESLDRELDHEPEADRSA